MTCDTNFLKWARDLPSFVHHGACMSSELATVPYSQKDRDLHRKAENELRELKIKLGAEVKVLLLGSGDSGKSTILKQMRLIHGLDFSDHEVETFRQLMFDNIIAGLKYLLDSMEEMDLEAWLMLKRCRILTDRSFQREKRSRKSTWHPSDAFGAIQMSGALGSVATKWLYPKSGSHKLTSAALIYSLNYFYSDLPRISSFPRSPICKELRPFRSRHSSLSR